MNDELDELRPAIGPGCIVTLCISVCLWIVIGALVWPWFA